MAFPRGDYRRAASSPTPIGCWCAPTSSRPATTSPYCTRCTWTRPSPASKRCRRSLEAQPRAPEEARRLRTRLPERRAHDQSVLRGLLPRDHPRRRDRSQQAPRPAGRPRRRGSLLTASGGRGIRPGTISRASSATNSTQCWTRASRATCSELDEDAQIAFKGTAKAFVRTYAFLSSVLPYTHAPWEQRSIFLNFLIPKLPAPLRRGPLQGDPRRH